MENSKIVKDINIIKESLSTDDRTRAEERMENFVQFIEKKYNIKLGYSYDLIDVLENQEGKKVRNAKKRLGIKINKIDTLNEFEQAKRQGLLNILEAFREYVFYKSFYEPSDISNKTFFDKIGEVIFDLECSVNNRDLLGMVALLFLYGFRFACAAVYFVAVTGFKSFNYGFHLKNAKKIKRELEKLNISTSELHDLIAESDRKIKGRN